MKEITHRSNSKNNNPICGLGGLVNNDEVTCPLCCEMAFWGAFDGDAWKFSPNDRVLVTNRITRKTCEGEIVARKWHGISGRIYCVKILTGETFNIYEQDMKFNWTIDSPLGCI